MQTDEEFLSESEAQAIISTIREAQAIISTIRESKRYDLVEKLVSSRGNVRSYHREVCTLCLEAYIERRENELPKEIFDTFKGSYIFSFLFGRQGLSLDEGRRSGVDIKEDGYLHGLISTDNAEMFKRSLPKDTGGHLYKNMEYHCGRYFALKCMNVLRPSEMRRFIKGGLTFNNRETITYVSRYEDHSSYLKKKFFNPTYICVDDEESLNFARWLLQEKFVVLDDDEWERLKFRNRRLYENLQNDV